MLDDKNTTFPIDPDSRSKLLTVLQLVKTKKEKLLFNNFSFTLVAEARLERTTFGL